MEYQVGQRWIYHSDNYIYEILKCDKNHIKYKILNNNYFPYELKMGFIYSNYDKYLPNQNKINEI